MDHSGKNGPTELTINGIRYEVPSDLPPLTSLNTFIRDHAHLKGTKFMCLEGGCGSCIVTVKSKHPYKMEDETYAVNSCLMPVFSCHGWEITTVEGIGDKKVGYHPVQKRLAEMNGTQCGYCSPGMVMNMYSLLEGQKAVTMKDVENSFGGNICRCTGYRPILDAFKSLTVDATPDLKQKVLDIEELCKIKICPKSGNQCNGRCDTVSNELPPSVHLKEAEWYNPTSLPELFIVFNKIGQKSYMLVGGNTGHGVYRVTPGIQVYINIGNVPELKVVSMEPTLTLGGNISLTEAMELFYKLSKEDPSYAYLKALADHIDLIANVPVRNTGTIAGNLALKNKHREFPSDVFLTLETVGATMDIEESGDKVTKLSMTAFLDMDMTHKVIRSISLPKLDESYVVRTFKIMPRAQNAHAYVNAGFMFKVNKSGNGKVLAKPSIVYGGITPELVHATNTEAYLIGKNLFDRKVLRTALKMLDTELHPDHVLPDATPAYRKGLAEALLYKFVLGLSPPGVSESLLSGGKDLERPISSGKQDFDTDKSVWPLNKPIPKLEAVAQCSGEAQYVNDMPAIHGELFAAFVITTVGQGYVASADTSEALSTPGVVAYLDVKDIPGKNSFIKPSLAGLEEEEEIFCSGNIKYAGQPVGIIVAETQQIAVAAAQKVKLEYMGIKKAITHIRDALASGDQERVRVEHKPKQVDIPGDAAHTIKGSLNFGSQYHYTMETHTTVCVPLEDGMDVFPASQWMDLTQITIAEALNVPENSINVKIKRIGGGYGAKISRASLVSAACAVAAHKLNKPVRMILPLETNTAALGKRSSVAVDYEVYVDENGKIKCLKLDMAEDAGCSWNEAVSPTTIHHMTSCYDDSNWAVTGKAVRTDTPSMTYCRAPGSTEGVGAIEFVMEHIAKVVKKDPIEVRINNMSLEDNPIPQMIKDLKATAAYDARKDDVIEFNKNNRWRKRGIALVPMTYPFPFWGNYSALVSIYSQDGTVAVTHGGVECGQGIHTKVAQVVAYTLGIPLEMVSVKASNTLTAPNGMVTGGSITSEVCAYAAMMCCKQLLERMEPVKKGLKNPTWQEWVNAAYKNDVDLCATYMYSKHDGLQQYGIYGVTIAEVELDLLTGRHLVLRVDIVEDAGKSMSPEIDVGQVEGAFIMGMGYWMMEYLVYSPETGELLTTRTWNYKPPGVKDIPIDFRVQLRKNAPNPFGVLRSKATGEPPFCMSCVLPIAVRNALDSARKDAGKPDEWYEMDAPATTENIFLTSLTNIDQFVL